MTLILDGVSVRQRGETWLDDIHLELSNGMTTLVGPMTAGKTTLMRVAAGLQTPDSGRVVVHGKDVTGISVRKRSVAFVYQQFINYPSLAVYENIASPLRLDPRFRSKSEIDRRVREVAELMGIAGLLDRRPAELSGGQQQRTAIARALARPVDVLLLDEPLANLDFKLREQLRADLKTMFADAPGVVLYSTADPNEALTFAAPTVVLGEGRVQHVGDVAEMYAHPPTLAVAATLSDPPLNLLPGVVREGRIEVLGTSFPAPRAHATGHDVMLGIRPHQVRIAREGPGALELPAEIRLAEVTGSATFLHLLLQGDRHLVAHLPGTQLFTPGETTVAYVDPTHVFVFDEAGGRLLATSAADLGGVHG
ncbi:carbohydrate ABC transporter ATP-binding protein (CUT1 family) [Nonomuraea polychroma]|uniref:Carbohydrate ABC transporter ATP-binding protein (CUT1 family) n=1 Tax=Nonomuraea polychroma TaxID=46176 RepID=A0A438MP81_9ACTN|nr:ABC transporter ATP-binding protein [Nonomuraea polychroma]RVX47722.1 carbohydrate ABC transporter ATP-binding protein (CUT1 family) [Nonomuraea polychroma]